MKIRFLTGEKRKAAVGQMIEVAFQITDDNGSPLSDVEVTITSNFPDDVVFQNGKPWAIRETGDGGVGTAKVGFVRKIENPAGEPKAKITFQTSDKTEAEMALECDGDAGALVAVPGGGFAIQGADGRTYAIRAPTQRHAAVPQALPGIVFIDLS